MMIDGLMIIFKIDDVHRMKTKVLKKIFLHQAVELKVTHR